MITQEGDAGPATVEPARRYRDGRKTLSRHLTTLRQRVVQLLVLMFVVATVLFFLIRLTGDPAVVLAGENASPDQLEAVRAHFGLDRPILIQYLTFMGHAALFDFGSSIQSGGSAMGQAMSHLLPTLQLAALAVLLNTVVAIPLGAWIGSNVNKRLQSGVALIVYFGQGLPGFVAALLLIQLFAVKLGVLPSVGNSSLLNYILPVVSLAIFLIPRLTRVLSSNVAEMMAEDYARTARASGASHRTVVVRHVLPNAILGATALVGTQLAILFSGALIIEVIFGWPGIGLLIIQSIQQTDFPVVQAAVFLISALVFITNVATDALLSFIDPRLRRVS